MSFTRRRFCATVAGAAPVVAFANPLAPFAIDTDRGIFQHGVASGDPLPDRVILWTRVTHRDRPGLIPVKWLMARDPELRRVVRSGKVFTEASRDFTVNIDADGLEPATTYYYRFESLGARSPIGRTRTLPVAAVERLRLAVVSCSNFPFGYFNVYRQIANRPDLDAVLHLGDYLYEYANGTYGDGTALGRIPAPNAEIVSLEDYRTRHAQYKSDPDLQEVHRQHPFITVWDDHESTNDSWRDGAENHQPDTEGDWQVRKQRSVQAYFEWMPIRGSAERPIYRSFRFGSLAELTMLDTRLYGREEQSPDPAVIASPDRQLLGAMQEQWLLERLSAAKNDGIQWRLLGQQVMFAQLSASFGASIINPDQWDGYQAARSRIFDHVESNGIDNLVVLTGDIHSSWANDLSRNPFNAALYDPVGRSGSLGVEFVTPAVSSPGIPDPVEAAQTAALLRFVSPHMKYIDLFQRGYVLLDVDAERVQGEWYYTPDITVPQAIDVPGPAFYADSGSPYLTQTFSYAAPKGDAAEPAP
jgi:alkaline phosphatase D